MYKIVDLGNEFASTGEPRARLLDTSLVKTAGTAIQDYWDSLEPNSDFAYLWVIGVSAMEYYGCNNNGDAFAEADLKATIGDWQKNANIFLHHANKDPNKSLGKPVFAWYNDDMHRVELVLAINKKANGAAAVVERIKNGDQLYVSMGCHVRYDVCSICGNKAKTRAEYCDHLRFNMKRILPDGKQVYALNPDPKFFDISIVTRPADPTAFALDKLASIGPVGQIVKSGAELGEEYTDLFDKSAAVRKLADIVKQVDGHVVGALVDPELAPVKQVAEHGFADFDYPEMPYDALDAAGASPHSLLAALCLHGCPPSIGDAYWMSGLHRKGIGLGTMLDLLPMALDYLADSPEHVNPCIADIFNDHGFEEMADPVRRAVIMQLVRPVAIQRITIIRQLAPTAKLAHDLTAVQLGDRPESNFAPIIVRDSQGNEIRTSNYYLNQVTSPLVQGINHKKALAGALAVAALSGIALAPSAAQKAMLGGVFGIPAAALFSSSNAEKVIVQNTGREIPVSTIMEAWKQPVTTKTAALGGNVGTYVGMLTPVAIGLDYAYNRWKANRQGYMEPNTAMHNLGRAVSDNPTTSLLAGGVLGTMAHLGINDMRNRRNHPVAEVDTLKDSEAANVTSAKNNVAASANNVKTNGATSVNSTKNSVVTSASSLKNTAANKGGLLKALFKKKFGGF